MEDTGGTLAECCKSQPAAFSLRSEALRNRYVWAPSRSIEVFMSTMGSTQWTILAQLFRSAEPYSEVDHHQIGSSQPGAPYPLSTKLSLPHPPLIAILWSHS